MLLFMLGCDVIGASVSLPADARTHMTTIPAQDAIATAAPVRLPPPHDPAAFYLTRANEAYQAHDFDGAIADYSAALVAQPDSADAYLGRGLAYYARDDLDGANQDFTQALTLRPDDATAFCSRGLVQRRLGQPDAARADFRACLEHTRDPSLLRGAAHQLQVLSVTPERR
jgi:tetratricopeptide (TPR) repeat protein